MMSMMSAYNNVISYYFEQMNSQSWYWYEIDINVKIMRMYILIKVFRGGWITSGNDSKKTLLESYNGCSVSVSYLDLT